MAAPVKFDGNDVSDVQEWNIYDASVIPAPVKFGGNDANFVQP